MKRLLLLAMALIAMVTNACAIRMENNGNTWFLPDGRIVQTKRVVTDNGSAYPGIMCYNQNGELLWEHTFRTPAVGRSCCELTDQNDIAFLYHDENHQYFVEYFHPDGQFFKKSTWERQTIDGMLYEGGEVYCEKLPQGRVLSLRHWDGREKRWEIQEAEKLTLYSVEKHGENVYIELYMQNSSKSAHSIVCVDEAKDVVLWEYRLDTAYPANACTGNEQGGITFFVQKDAPNDQYEMEMITLDENGTERNRSTVEGIPAVMAMNVIESQKDGLYQIWGYGYETYGENAVIHAVLNDQGKVVKRQDIPAAYATCVRYLNDEIYVMEYENGLADFELIPFEDFANK